MTVARSLALVRPLMLGAVVSVGTAACGAAPAGNPPPAVTDAVPAAAPLATPAAAAVTSETTITGPSGASLFLRQIGNGPQVVVSPLAYWNQDQFERIAEGRTFVFYDPRGRRRSTPVKGPSEFGIDADLADLDAVVRHTGAARVSLVGTSYYGAVVARYAMANPGRVASLVMVAPLYPRREPYISAVIPGASTRRDPAAMQAFSKLRDAGLEQTDPQRYCLEFWKVEGAMTVVDLASLNGRTWPCDLPNEWPSRTAAWGQAVFASLGNWNWIEDAKKVRAPALLVQGDSDLMTPRAATEEWATLLPNARLEIVPRGGAVLWWERADVIFPMIDRFLETQAPALAPPRKPAAPEDAFLAAINGLCGKAFGGRIVANEPAAPTDPFVGQSLVMHVRECGVGVTRVPFHVGANRSRTWVLSRTAAGLRLKHDHRHEDGSPDAVTMYGGDTAGAGTAERQAFPVDAESRALFEREKLTASVTNTWAMEIVPGRRFVYELTRPGRTFRVEFDLTKPVPPPPPPWGGR